jgi:hypothetical protein
MPLSLPELEEIQADCLADDIGVDLQRMRQWTRAQAVRYFESGGVEEPPALILPSAAELLAGGHARPEFQAVLARLRPLGPAGPALPGEEKAASRGCCAPKPDARARLFVFYGVADVAMSTQSWVRSAPAWVEARLVDFPGHGFRSHEPLPACAAGGHPLDEAAIAAQRHELV